VRVCGVRLGVLILPEHADLDGLRTWQRLEELGVGQAWTFDHLSWRTLRDRPWYDALTLLAAVAAGTRRMTLGTLVTTPNFRHPVVAAKQVMTLDRLSGGRFVLGLGAGAGGPDATVLGGDPAPDGPARAERFAEFVELLDELLRRPVTTRRGRHFAAVDTRMVPGCVQRPRVPFAIAAAGRRGMRLALRHAGIWVSNGGPRYHPEMTEAAVFAGMRAELDRLAEACAEAGGDPAELRRLVFISRVVPDVHTSAERLRDVVGRCAELGFTDVVVGYPRPGGGVQAGDPAKFERMLSRLG
jgi:alkanesulfonate monooxygenase SsuD/methylene tetrahydromethanopterin reductase-like flavin-dependent oxidoreductase (luciferase family)